ncbi:MAG: 3-oxoacyl-[acyl-carrier-protein] reductase [Peptococcaceae bacterium]|nr:3-oxoacyl-[acyl-carrier-protein] reductase [Peptococcaceae bacterium]
MEKNMKGKVCVVTGGSRGIGRGIALELAGRGACLVINYHRSENQARDVQSEIEAIGGRALVVRGNMALEEDVKNLFAAVLAEFGRVDVLVNNAGVTRDGLVARMSAADYDEVLDLNLKGAFLCSRAAAKIFMKQRSGKIIMISSVVGLMGNAGQCNYAAAKAGLIGLTKSLARELGPRSVTVNAIAPGFIVTDMTQELSEEAKGKYIESIPLGRLGQVQDVARAAAFLASPDADYITGQVLVVDGGLRC